MWAFLLYRKRILLIKKCTANDALSQKRKALYTGHTNPHNLTKSYRSKAAISQARCDIHCLCTINTIKVMYGKHVYSYDKTDG